MSRVICESLGGDICCYSNGLRQGASFEFRIFVEETHMMHLLNKRGRLNQGRDANRLEPINVPARRNNNDNISNNQLITSEQPAARAPVSVSTIPSLIMENNNLGVSSQVSVLDELDNNLADRRFKRKIIVCVDNSFVNLTSLGLMLEMSGFQGEV